MIDFSLYPNLNGNLGENKVQIPDGVTTFWPDGDALVGNFIYKDGKLSGFVDTKALIANDNKTTTIPYDYFKAEMENVREDSVKFNLSDRCKYFTLKLMPKYKGCKTLSDIVKIEPNYKTVDIVDGVWNKDLEDLEGGGSMFSGCESLITFTSDLSSLINSGWMFQNCSNLTTFKCNDLCALEYGKAMFVNCSSLTSFDINLSNMTNGDSMFAYCSSLTAFTSDLSSLINGNNMFIECSKLSSFECQNLSSFTNAANMFMYCSSLTSFDYDLSNLTNCSQMFYGCTNLSSFNSNLSNLNIGYGMFYANPFTSFNISLKSLTNARWMFLSCSKLESFSSDLSSLIDGGAMFSACSNLKNFDCPDLGSLTDGNGMFDNCRNLTTFDSDLKSLTDGTNMFHLCWALISFKSNLNSLTDGNAMFNYCKLDAPSIKNIIDTINTVESAPLGIGMGCNNNITDVNLFAQEVGYPDMTTLLQTLQDKGWTVTAQYNGRPTSNYSLRQPESLPIYVKLVEVVLPVNEEEITPIYEYTSSDETKFYNLDWFHETTGSTDGYTQFNSLQEAISTLNIKQIEK